MTEIGAATPRIPNAELVIGGRPNLRAMEEVAGRATQQLDVDLFAGTSPTLNKVAESGRGMDSLFLADPEVKAPVRKVVADNGGTFVKVGDMPQKNHAKSVIATTADDVDAFITTAAFAPRTPGRYEVGVRFGGDAALAARELVRARASGDAARIAASADEARKFGIVLNDPQHGIWHLSEDVRGLVGSAQERQIIASKRVKEKGFKKLIAEVEKRGVPTVQSKLTSKGSDLHANIIIADDRAYIGSGHLTKRVLTGGGTEGRISRELGVIIDDKAMVDRLARSLADNGYIPHNEAMGIPKPPSRLSTMSTGAKLGIAGAGIALAAGLAIGVPKLVGGKE